MTDRNRLIEILKNAKYPLFEGYPAEILLGTQHSNLAFEYIADCLLANGVILLPCKVGDIVYKIDLFDFEPCKKSGKNGDVCPHLYGEYGGGYDCVKGHFGEKPLCCAEIKPQKIECMVQIFLLMADIGKTVFLTKEEAEKALKEGR